MKKIIKKFKEQSSKKTLVEGTAFLILGDILAIGVSSIFFTFVVVGVALIVYSFLREHKVL